VRCDSESEAGSDLDGTLEEVEYLAQAVVRNDRAGVPPARLEVEVDRLRRGDVPGREDLELLPQSFGDALRRRRSPTTRTPPSTMASTPSSRPASRGSTD
jgi:hypothetical protein